MASKWDFCTVFQCLCEATQTSPYQITHTLRYQFIWMLLFLLSESLMFNICLHFVREPLNQLKGHIEAIASGGVEHES